jgi:hypothetical protein
MLCAFLDMRIHPEITWPPADDTVAAQQAFALEATPLEHFDGAVVRGKHGCLDTNQPDSPTWESFAMRG